MTDDTQSINEPEDSAADTTDIPLETGWLSTTPEGDNFLRDAVESIAERVRHMARAMGHRMTEDADLLLADHDSPSIFANKALLLTAVSEAGLRKHLERAREFMREGSANPFLLWSALPTPDLTAEGFSLVGHPPVMYRPAGGEATPTPEGLEIVEALDKTTLLDFERTFVEGFPIGDLLPYQPKSFVDERAIGGPIRFFVGYLDGEPVASGGVCVARGMNMVEFIATLPGARGRGIGEAMTWKATLFEPSLPAALVASDLGRPVYERMGFIAISRCTLWVGE